MEVPAPLQQSPHMEKTGGHVPCFRLRTPSKQGAWGVAHSLWNDGFSQRKPTVSSFHASRVLGVRNNPECDWIRMRHTLGAETSTHFCAQHPGNTDCLKDSMLVRHHTQTKESTRIQTQTSLQWVPGTHIPCGPVCLLRLC